MFCSERFDSKRIFFILLFLIAPGAVSAQTQTGALSGVITDENKALIPAARIILINENGTKRETVSGADGGFAFEDLAFGKYVLTIEKTGFAVQTREIAVAAVNQNSDLTLSAGAVAEAVTIVLDGAEAAVESTLKLPASIHETPRSLTVVGRERIREQNFGQVSDVLNYVPGTAQNSYRNGGYHFYARGYRMSPDDTRLDGFAGINVGGGGFGASLFGIEEVVVLRGPAGLIYGQSGAPGGFINLISKKPLEKRFTRVDLRGGGYQGRGVSIAERPSLAIDVDSTGAIWKSDRVLYRALLTIENQNYFTADTLDRNRYANGSLSFKLDRDGRFVITPSAQFTRYHRPYGGGIVVSPSSSLRTSDGLNQINATDLSSLDVNLSFGRRIEETRWGGLDFRAAITDRLRANAAYRYVSFDTDINSFTPQVSTTQQINQLINQNTVSRVQAKSLTNRNYNNLNADAVYEWGAAGWWRNTTQIGFYQRILDSRATAAQGAVPAAQSPINIYTGRVSSAVKDNFPPLAFGAWARDLVWNGFVQNRTALDNGRWNVTVGFNYGQNKPATGATRKSGIVPNAAVVFNATPTLAVYGSYSTSFNPIDPDFENAAGERGAFAPTIGKNFEIGAKYDLLSRRVSLAAAVFQNQIDNALAQSDANVFNSRGNRFYVAAGTRRARGAEATGEFQIRQDLRLSAGVSRLDAIYKGSPANLTANNLPAQTSPLPNSRAEKSPRWSGNFYARYDRRKGYLKGFGAGFGATFQGRRLGSNGAQTFAAPDPLVLPASKRVDSALFYRLNRHVDFALNVENVFDSLVFVSGSVGSSIEIAAPRAVTFRTGFSF